jgi:hypothetical protein
MFMPPPLLALALAFLFLLELFFELLPALLFIPPPVVAVELDVVVVVVVPPALAFLLPPEHDFRNMAREAARTRAKIFGIVVLLFFLAVGSEAE